MNRRGPINVTRPFLSLNCSDILHEVNGMKQDQNINFGSKIYLFQNNSRSNHFFFFDIAIY